MSLAMNAARGRYRGDPGFFSSLGGIIKGVGNVLGVIPGIGNTIKGVTGVVGGLMGAGSSNPPVLMTQPKPAGIGSSLALPLSAPAVLRINATSMPGTGAVSNMTVGGPGDPNSTAVQLSRNAGLTRAGLAPSGYHLNKTGYWVNGNAMIPGAHYVAPGTQLVKNRRSNPLNPHALSRSLRRLQGFARATKHMRAEAHKIATAVAPQSKRGCAGCRKKR